MQKIKQYFITAMAFLCTILSAAAQQRQHINFDNDWKFAFGNASNPEKDFNYGLHTIFSKSGALYPQYVDWYLE